MSFGGLHTWISDSGLDCEPHLFRASPQAAQKLNRLVNIYILVCALRQQNLF